MINDQSAREHALDPAQSFIVQAPAGSGKTELLTQRYLRLLSTVANPEEIIAITFTKKAASEMRQRIISALQAATQDKPTEPHKLKTWQLATSALLKNKQGRWHLLQNPNRLKIQTIDSLAAGLCSQMPLLSEHHAQFQISDAPTPYYKEACDALFSQAINNKALYKALQTLLMQVDNNAARLSHLFIAMLKVRDQWLRHIMPHYTDRERLKTHLENSLEQLALSNIQEIINKTDERSRDRLFSSALFSSIMLDDTTSIENLNSCTPHLAQTEDLDAWKYLAHMLLTQSGGWRKTIDKRLGFPATHKQEKQTLLELIDALRDDDALLEALKSALETPPIQYSKTQWPMIEALIDVLPILVAELNMCFESHQVTDFVGLNLSAQQALGTADAPTDLALYLDYKISHLLIDEFQDTSLTQYQLINQIITEWHPEDQRTLFLVGDPMQSIYRFRQADVSLFTQTQKYGMGPVALTPLSLTQNFRSSDDIVAWFNHAFPHIFPSETNIAKGAISYSPAFCPISEPCETPTRFDVHESADKQEEANAIVAHIKQLQAQHPQDTTALLAQSRSQLIEIMAQLRDEHIPFDAVDIDPLHTQPEIQDLCILLRALAHLADDTAWYAFLRAPFCGLLLEDLHTISQHSKGKPIWLSLSRYTTLPLSPDALTRLSIIVPIMQSAIAQAGRMKYSDIILTLCSTLNIHALYPSAKTQKNITDFISHLLEYETEHPLFSFENYQDELIKLYAGAQSMDANLHVMTIHKSKGLEFDHVILPNLAKAPINEENSLLLWNERSQKDHVDLILAPLQSPDESADPIYQFCKTAEKQKLHYETARLFYVAVTRAKKSVYGFSRSNKVRTASFLSFIKSQGDVIVSSATTNLTESQDLRPPLKRIKATTLVALVDDKPQLNILTAPKIHINDQITLKRQASIGTILHEELYYLTQRENTQAVHEGRIHQKLRQAGFKGDALSRAEKSILSSLHSMKKSVRGQWILAHHTAEQSEYALTTTVDGPPKHIIIDRTFIDNGSRWIIDYKSAVPHDTVSDSDFLAFQKIQHCEQLEYYAKILSINETHPIVLGLYFPLVDLWHEWHYSPTEESP
jgi:ATP-dependent helicase/nuclease subunit A